MRDAPVPSSSKTRPRRAVAPQGHGSYGAASAGEQESSSCGSPDSTPKESASSDLSEHEYVRAVLERYLWLPGTSTVTSRHDRACARALFGRGVPLDVVKSAMLLAVARRTFRGGNPLPRVRALHYFLPVVQEVLEFPDRRDPSYQSYLERKLQPLAAAKRNASGGIPLGPSSGADSRESVAEPQRELSCSSGQEGASLDDSRDPERYPEAPARASSHRQAWDRDEAARRRWP